MLSPFRPARLRLRGEQGFTLIETLVAILTGLVVTFATFAILDVSLSQSSRIADRVSADQRGRLAMEKLTLVLHSSCIAPNVTPVEKESTENKIRIISQTGAESSFATVELHELSLASSKLTDTTYLSTGKQPAPNWEFSATPAKTTTLLTGVSPSENAKKELIPVFQYYGYVGSELSKTPLPIPLNATTANEAAAIAVNFTVAPDSSNSKADRPVELSETVVLRFSPASPTGSNIPCA
jgi:type II secretory pathway pseudopilin PulG